jgi:hypothetical protein
MASKSPARGRRQVAEPASPAAGAGLNPALPLEYWHTNVQTAVVLHISAEKPQHRLQVVDGDFSLILTSVDMRATSSPVNGGRGR